MGSMKWVCSVLLLLVVVGVGVGVGVRAQAQVDPASCNSQMSGLSVCAPFVVPGVSPETNPSADCCAALGAVQQDCLCNTVRIASRLPTQCSLPALTCPN